MLLIVIGFTPPIAFYGLALVVYKSAAGFSIFMILMVGTVMFFVTSAFVARVTLLYPAIAIDNRSLTYKHSWELTRNNTMRLWGGTILAIVPFMIIYRILLAGVNHFASTSGGLILALFLEILVLVVMFVQIAVVASFLSFSYKFFVEGVDQAKLLGVPLTLPGPEDTAA